MTSRSSSSYEIAGIERLAALSGFAVAAAVGVLPVLGGLSGDPPIDGPVGLWWASYIAFLAAFYIDGWLPNSRPRWLTAGRLVTAEVLFASVTYLLSARYGWSGVLFVITAVAAAFVWDIRTTARLVALQSAVVAIGQVAADLSASQAVLSTLAYASFQAFAVLMVHTARREAAARSELASAHAELRASSAMLAESSRATERLRIARDLHDVVGHQLTALSLELEVASHHVDGAASEHVRRARGISKDLLTDVRNAVGQMRAPSDGIAGPLRAVVDGISTPQIELRVIEEGPIDEAHALAVVRCVQEIVTNTLRHANAQHLSINVSITNDGVQVDARDDGSGVDDFRPGHGLAGMRERIEHLGGQLELETASGRGFQVHARVPSQ